MRQLPPLYLITDRHQVPAGKQLLPVLEDLLRAGVKMLQLREKDLSAAELLPLAQELRELTGKYHCLLLIDDRIDVAMAVDADGVHLGGHSLPPAAARELLGTDKLIGVSTHSLEELTCAEAQGADFATFGPIFHTPSKAAYGPPLGLEKLQRSCSQCALPIYGLGGVKRDNAASITQAGAHGIALISALLKTDSPSTDYQNLLKALTS